MTWRVGDLAVCVDDGPCTCCGAKCPATAGGIYRVIGLAEEFGVIGLHLGLPPVPTHAGVNSSSGSINERRFRKVTPDKHEACEDEFVTLLKRSKRKVGA